MLVRKNPPTGGKVVRNDITAMPITQIIQTTAAGRV
jgi:hypothetical protein